jgi:putative endonuclease
VAAFVYIMASGPYGTLYVGVTNDVARRAWEHREGHGSAFCRKYGVHRLVHIEGFGDIQSAIAREKRLKKWPRRWKINLIESGNPGWRDLYETLNSGGYWAG